MKRRYITLTLCLLMAFVLFTGCQGPNAAVDAQTANGETQSAIVGQITAIDGEQLTLALGTLSGNSRPDQPDNGSMGSQNDQQAGDGADATTTATVGEEGEAGGQQPPNGGGNSTGSGQPSGEKPSGEIPSGGLGGGMGGYSFTASGEEMTVTVTDSTVITLAARRIISGAPGSPEDKNSGETTGTQAQQSTSQTGTLSDLKVGDIITVTLSGTTATAITAEPSGGMGDGPGGSINGEPSNEETGSDDAASSDTKESGSSNAASADTSGALSSAL